MKPLRPRTPEMDAIVKSIHGSPAFKLRNAVKAVRKAIAKRASLPTTSKE